MNFNTDGFNERSNYIHNSNDKNRLNQMGTMKIDENKPGVQTTKTDTVMLKEEVRGAKENFVLRNHNMMNANSKSTLNNPVSNAMNRNMFKKF